jgi:hypothetical protein
MSFSQAIFASLVSFYSLFCSHPQSVEKERLQDERQLTFGLVCAAIDVLLLLCAAMVLKDRKERARYRLIDAKNGFGPI